MTTHPTPEDLRRMTYDTTEAIADGWERRRATIEDVCTPLRFWLVEAISPRPGQTVLELAAGIGDTGYEAAAMLGPEGRLISTDFAPTMLGAARRRSAELGVDNVEHRLLDAERMELDTDSVDGVICRFGYMLMGDPAAALAETRRVLRAGGNLALAVWGPPERNPFFTAAALALVGAGKLPPPDPDVPGIFYMAAEERLRTMLARAGFSSVRTEEMPLHFPLPDLEEYIDFLGDTAGPLALAIRALSDAERDDLKEPVRDALAPYEVDGSGSYDVPGIALCAAAS